MPGNRWQRVFSILLMVGMVLSLAQPVAAQTSTRPKASSSQVNPPVTNLSVPQASPDTANSPQRVKIDIGAPVAPKLSRAVRDLPISEGGVGQPSAINPPRGKPNFQGTDKNILDPLVAHGLNQSKTPDPLFTFEGIGDLNFYTPPDTEGDVGPNNYIQIVNAKFAIYDKSGNLLYGPVDNNSLWDGFGGQCELTNDGDPIVLYDDMADRWMITQFSVESVPYQQCVAVSTSPDPLGTYYLYAFQMPDFPDYPKFGVWPDGYYLGTNTGFPHSYYAHVFDRNSMLAGLPATRISFGGYDNFLMPADADGTLPPPAGSPEYFYTYYSEGYPDHPPGVDRLAIYEFHADWANPANSTFTLATEIPIDPFNYTVCGFFGPYCIPEPSPGVGLDTLSWWPMVRLQYRNFGPYEGMVSNFTVDVDGTDHAGIRWFELRKSGANPWGLQQEGTYAPDASHRWMGSIAMDGSGNLALGYSVSDATVTKPSIRYTVHEANDPPGTMQTEAVIINGTGVNTGPYGRWGDYSAMNVDPTDQCTFWYTNEYHDQNESSFLWNTRVGVFKLASCTGSLGPTGTLSGMVDDGSNPISGALISAENITATYQTTSDSGGDYSMTLPVGSFDVTASAFGYIPETVSNIEIISGTTTTQDFSLAAAPAHTVSGVVTDAAHGWPLYAQIAIGGAPLAPVWTDPVTGFYSLSLPEGITYTFTANAFVAGYIPQSVDVGPLTGDETVNLQLTADPDLCIAPGYLLNVTGVNETFDSGSLPPGWSNIDNYGLGQVWLFNDPGGRGNNTGGMGNFAIEDSDYYGPSGFQDAELRTPVMDLSSLASVTLEFKYDFVWYSGGLDEHADADVSIDGGSTWTNVWTRSGASDPGPKTASVDISAIAAGQSNVVVRFHYYNANWEWWWEVDDVFVGTKSCDPLPGGLVVGNVYDQNSGLPLVGASVSNDDGYSTTALATPDDPAVDDAFYTLFSSAGDHDFTATLTGYSPDVETVTVVANDTVAQNFSLGTGHLTADPTSFDVSVDLGASTTLPLTLSNDGTGDATFAITEKDRGFLPAQPGTMDYLPLPPPADPGVFAYNGLDGEHEVSRVPYIYHAPGEANQNFSILVYADDDQRSPTAVEDGLQALGLSYTFYGYTTDGSGLGAFYTDLTTGGPWDFVIMAEDSWTYIVPQEYDAMNDFINAGGKAIVHSWAVNYDSAHSGHPLWTTLGGTFSAWITLPENLYWWDASHPLFTTPESVPEFTSLTNLGYLAYGAKMNVIDGVGTALGGFSTAPADGEAGIILRDDGMTIYKGLTDNLNGSDLDADGMLDAAEWWENAANGVLNGFNQDVPWLSEVPITGTVPVGGSQAVDVTFDASALGQPGDYLASLQVNTDTPYDPIDIPVTMTVAAPPSWGQLNGTVTGLGYCDANPAPLEGAVVTIAGAMGTFTTTTDANGYYTWWLDEANSPVSVTVDYPGYEQGLASGVIITGGSTTTVDFNLRLLEPCLSVSPGSLSANLDLGSSVTLPLSLINNGAGEASFTMSERDRGVQLSLPRSDGNFPRGSAPASLGRAPQVSSPEAQLELPGVLSVLAGAPAYAIDLFTNDLVTFSSDDPTVWTVIGNVGSGYGFFGGDFLNGDFSQEYVVDYYTNQLYVVDTATAVVTLVGPATPNSGESWTGLAGAPDGTLYGSATTCAASTLYTVDPATGATTAIGPVTNAPCLIDIAVNADGELYGVDIVNDNLLKIDPSSGAGTIIGSIGFDANYAQGLDFEEESGVLYMAAFNNSTFSGEFRAFDLSTGNSTLIGTFPGGTEVDSLAFATGGVSDVPWLSESPVTGTVPADSSVTVNVTFDASTIGQPGEYLADLNVKSDDPANDNIVVPVTMTVAVPAGWGQLDGTVTGAGVPLEGATVTIQGALGTFTTTTDANGYYAWWLDSANSPLTVTVTADGYQTGQQTGVVIVAGQTTTVDFDLSPVIVCTTNCLRVNRIEMRVTTPGVAAQVLIQDENGNNIVGAKVRVRWDLPDGLSVIQKRITGDDGRVSFKGRGGAGTYTITVTDVSLNGYTFDPANSAILTNSITK